MSEAGPWVPRAKKNRSGPNELGSTEDDWRHDVAPGASAGVPQVEDRSGPNDPSGQISSDVTPDREPGVESERRQLTTPVFD